MDENVRLLHEAIENGNEQLIDTLIKKNVNLKARNDRGMNCLHLAVERSSLQIVQRLLKADQSLVDEVVISERESEDIDGYTALHFCAKRTDLLSLLIVILLPSGVKGDVVDKNLRTPLHVAALYGNTNVAGELLRQKNAPVNAEDCEGKTAVICAVERNHVDTVKLMFELADKETLKSYAKAIIDIASDSKCLKFVQLLPFYTKTTYDEMLIIILQRVIEKKRFYVVDNLLFRINILLDNTRTIATVDRVNLINIKVAQFLMNYYIIKFVNLEAALHLALVNNCNDIVNTYLKKGVNVDCKDAKGNSLLYITCIKNNLDAAKKCIALGCDVHVQNCFGNTALHAAGKHVNPELVYLLKESGCKLHTKNDNFETPFEVFLKNLSIYHGNFRNDTMQNNVIKVAKMLFKPGMDLNYHGNSKVCVLHSAVKTGILELVEMVIKCHPSLDHLNNEQGTCLHIAAELNYTDVVKLLLELRANPDVQDKYGCYPIAIAINLGHEKIVKLLVNYLDLNSYINLDNRTLMHYAAEANSKESVSALVCAGVDLFAEDITGRSAICYASCDYNFEYSESVYEKLLNLGFDVNVGYHERLEGCICWSNFYKQEFAMIHVLKLHLIKYELKPFLTLLIDIAEIKFQDVYSDIRKEAERLMTSRIPDTIIPFTDIIKLDDKKLANYARNESVVQVFRNVDSLKIEWPHYSDILIGRMTKGFVRRRLLDKCYVIFNRDGPKLRPECVELIFDNLETCELNTFIVSFPSVDTSEFDDLWFIH